MFWQVSPDVNVLIYVFHRNLSSVNERTRQKMRDMPGLVDSLVSYIQQEERPDDKVTLTSTVMALWHTVNDYLKIMMVIMATAHHAGSLLKMSVAMRANHQRWKWKDYKVRITQNDRLQSIFWHLKTSYVREWGLGFSILFLMSTNPMTQDQNQ